MERNEYKKFLKWVDKSTYFFQDKDVTVDQVVDKYILDHRREIKTLRKPDVIKSVCIHAPAYHVEDIDGTWSCSMCGLRV